MSAIRFTRVQRALAAMVRAVQYRIDTKGWKPFEELANARKVLKLSHGRVPLIIDPERDYVMHGHRVWITVGPFSVLLNRTHEGLIVDVWEKGAEDGDSLDTLSLMDPQPEDEVD